MNDELIQMWVEIRETMKELEKKYPLPFKAHCNTCKCEKEE
jgi:hypothetical protein